MPVGYGSWKASEPLSDPDQLLSIAKHDPNVNAKQVVGVCNTQQRLVYPLELGRINFPNGPDFRGSASVAAQRSYQGRRCNPIRNDRIPGIHSEHSSANIDHGSSRFWRARDFPYTN